MSVTAELKRKDALIGRRSLVDDIVSELQQSPNNESQLVDDQFDESRNAVLLRGDGG